jgi:hypothetical protein
MPRGRRNPDPTLVSDIDLMTLRPSLQAIADGAPPAINIMQIARLCEGLLVQYRHRIPKNKRGYFDKIIKDTIEHAIGFTGILNGETLTLLRMHEKDFITTENGNRHLAEIDWVEAHYTKVAASQAIRTMDAVSSQVNSAGTGRGRKPAPVVCASEIDWQLLSESLERLTPDRGSIEAWCAEIRNVVANAIDDGRLPARGSCDAPKEGKDIHSRRLQSYAKRIDGTIPKS